MKIHPIWFICILTRLFLAYIIYSFGIKNNYSITALLAIIGIGFIFNGYYGSNGTMQIAKVFCHDTRYIHGTLYILSAAYLLNGNKTNASLLIVTDIAFSMLYRVITDR